MERVDANCPSCGFTPLKPIYEARDVPVHSCMMLGGREEAVRFPRGDVLLAFCRRCGFITNSAYDPSYQDYAPGYEDQQSYSPTFNAFAHRLADGLIDRYDLRGKTIVEIGCGKADFLALLCELGDNRGIGIDPACDETRLRTMPGGERITVIRDYYSEKYAGHTGDLMMCRHTLEHIHGTADFLTTLRRGIGDRMETDVFFEVPDTMRVLREAAFWDIYYEHCSYFTPGSLARLFRICGFAVDDLALDYDDQYLLIYARPVERRPEGAAASPDGGKNSGNAPPPMDGPDEILPLEESVEELIHEVDRFREAHADTVARWRSDFKRYGEEGKRVAVWGSGSKCVAFLTTIGIGAHVDRIVDINPHRHGKYIPGVGEPVRPPASLGERRPDVVVVMNPIYRDEIAGELREMGLEPEIVAV